MSEDTELFRRRVRASLQRNREAFEALPEHRQALDELLGLSEEQIQAIAPDDSNKEAYTNLLSVVKEATRVNVAQAELKRQIQALGETAVAIAKKTTALRPLF